VILDPHPDSDQHRNAITPRGSPTAMPAKFGRHRSTRSWGILRTDGRRHGRTQDPLRLYTEARR